MTQALQQLSLPSRQEVAALAERFTNVEMRLDDMDAKLDRIERLLGREQPAPPAGRGESPQRRRRGEGSAIRRREPAAGVSRLGARARLAPQEKRSGETEVSHGAGSRCNRMRGRIWQQRLQIFTRVLTTKAADRPNAERTGVGAEQGEALPVHAGGPR